MAKPYKIPDFRKLYPEASEEVIAVLRMTERKMQYQEYDLKTERTVIDQKTQTVRIIPSREDSYERLLEQEVQFEGENQTEERDLAEELKIYHNAVHKRKNRILKKLKNILENL